MRWGRPLALCALWLAQLLVYLLLKPRVPAPWAFVVACCAAAPFALRPRVPLTRRVVLACGFIVSFGVFEVAGHAPPWIWLVLLALAAAVFPVLARVDAPLWPSPGDVAQRLPVLAPLPAGSLVIDAGSGLGHAVRALARAYPACRVVGIEASALLVWLSRAWPVSGRPRFVRADLWRYDWSDAALVYLFLRPEAMQLAYDKACAEMSEVALLVSLEFALPVPEHLKQRLASGQMIYLYRVADLRAGHGSAANR
jgi:SAM-dependent methyltransferase